MLCLYKPNFVHNMIRAHGPGCVHVPSIMLICAI